jgi:hypothetical protein
MMNVLAHLENENLSFRPRTPAEFFALQMARKLHDVGNLPHYIELVARYRDDQILRAFRHVFTRPTSQHVDAAVLEAELVRILNRDSDG